METINFYSYKGGVGRTMLTAHIARFLAGLGKHVVIADFDFDAPGIPAIFGLNIFDNNVIKGGLRDLFDEFPNLDKPTNEFQKRLEEYLIPIDNLSIKGQCVSGRIQILPTGLINDAYWNRIAESEWLKRLASTQESSFGNFILNVLKKALEQKVDYLLIDSRAGITYYSAISRRVANRQAIIFCPNKEAKNAVTHLLADALKNFQEKRERDGCRNKGIFQNNEPSLKRFVLVVSRMPPELSKKRNEVFKDVTQWIQDSNFNKIEGYKGLFKFHSDLQTHLEPQLRFMDDQFLDEKDRGQKHHVVQIHEDILVILAKLCPELLSSSVSCEDLDIMEEKDMKTQAHKLWEQIFKNLNEEDRKFKITFEHRMFGFLHSGEMINDDGNRNIAFRVSTFLEILNHFYDALQEGFRNIPDELKDREKTILASAQIRMNDVLFNAGRQCGSAFGNDIIDLLKHEDSTITQKEKIDKWCEFDTRAGFGLMSYNQEDTITIENLFIDTPNGTKNRDYTAFFIGYVVGVLEKLLSSSSNELNALAITTKKNTSSFKGVYDKDRFEVAYAPINVGDGIIIKFTDKSTSS